MEHFTKKNINFAFTSSFVCPKKRVCDNGGETLFCAEKEEG